MGLLSLIQDCEDASPKMRDRGPRLHFIEMAKKGYTNEHGQRIPSMLGTIKFLPIKDLNGKDLKYFYDLKSYSDYDENGNYFTSRVPESSKYEAELSDDDKALILQARSVFDSAFERWGYPYGVTQDYAIMFGYILEHVSEDGDTITDSSSRKAALLMFKSKNFARGLNNCLRQLQDYGDGVGDEMYDDLFSRNTERHYYLTIDFTKNDQGIGYNTVVSADNIDRKCSKFLTKEEVTSGTVVIPEEQMDFCRYLSAQFLSGDSESGNDFDAKYLKGVIDSITKEMDKQDAEAKKKADLPPLPNKNKPEPSDLDK